VTAHPELQVLSPTLAVWHAFDRSVKADLFSTAVSSPSGVYLIDPIPLPSDFLRELQAQSPVVGIVVTNQNHWRAAPELAEELSVPIFAHAAAAEEQQARSLNPLAAGDRIGSDLEVIGIDGAAPGEIAIYIQEGTVVVGDALINFEPYGFTFLPPKYCIDPRKMRKSLEQLAHRHFDRLLFAHGFPIMRGGSDRLQALLQS
jgi:glyoxylase-like metal-dependent hydrolase (beta-lactamase superfamily II)